MDKMGKLIFVYLQATLFDPFQISQDLLPFLFPYAPTGEDAAGGAVGWMTFIGSILDVLG